MRILIALLLLAPLLARAQDADTALRAQLRAAEDQIAADKAEIGQLRAAAAGAVSAQDFAAVQSQNTQLRQNLQSLRAAADNFVKTNQTRDQAALTALSDRNQACIIANRNLAGLAHDILHLYETQSFGGILMRSYEPILGLDRVKLENIIQTYDDKIDDQKIAETPTGALTN